MATFTVLDSISRSDTFPITYDYSAEYNCGILSLEISSAWSNQMLLELPCINFKILKSDGTLFRTFSINMSTVNTDLNTGISAAKPYIIPFYDIPKSGSFHITPMFDKNAIAAHNEMERNGIVNSINTTDKGVVTTDDIDIWTNTDVFDITIEFSNDNISSGGAGGGGGDTPTLIDKNITANGTYLASDDDADGYSSVVVDVPSGGGSSTTKKDVNFYDYDGTIVKSYTAQEFAALDNLPENPTHEGLTGQGWNWSLQDAKTYVSSYGKLDIGQMYITSDGKTRIYIELSEGRTSPWLKLYLNANSELDIDWGDGSSHSTFTSTSADYKNEQHIYSNAGSYVIAITVITGGFVLQSSSTKLSTILTNNNNSSLSPDRSYLNSMKKVEIGNNVTSIKDDAFYGCSSLFSITIPNSVTSIGNSALYNCASLFSITIPNSVTSIGSTVFQNCYSLSSITIPSTVTSISNTMFYSCYSLSSITIPNSVTSIGSNVIYGCLSLSSIIIPNSVTSIGNSAFGSCFSLSSITLPSSVTSIAGSAFNTCYSLSSITLPSSVTSIGNSAFYGCSYLEYCRFEITSPISISNSNTFGGWDSTLTKIFCPAEGLEAYKTATNYPNPSTFKYIGFATYEAGVQLPTTTQDQLYTYTWYATVEDWINNTNPITVGNGSEIYANITAV